jgi:hypothetical protein
VRLPPSWASAPRAISTLHSVAKASEAAAQPAELPAFGARQGGCQLARHRTKWDALGPIWHVEQDVWSLFGSLSVVLQRGRRGGVLFAVRAAGDGGRLRGTSGACLREHSARKAVRGLKPACSPVKTTGIFLDLGRQLRCSLLLRRQHRWGWNPLEFAWLRFLFLVLDLHSSVAHLDLNYSVNWKERWSLARFTQFCVFLGGGGRKSGWGRNIVPYLSH